MTRRSTWIRRSGAGVLAVAVTGALALSQQGASDAAPGSGAVPKGPSVRYPGIVYEA
jgi:hypothetical protein